MALEGCTVELLGSLTVPALRALQQALEVQIAAFDTLAARAQLQIARMQQELLLFATGPVTFATSIAQAIEQFVSTGVLRLAAQVPDCLQVGELVAAGQELAASQRAAYASRYSQQEYQGYVDEAMEKKAEYEGYASMLREVNDQIDVLVTVKVGGG